MKHFTIAELSASATAQCRGIDNTPTAEAVENLTLLVENVLDPLREVFGSRILINSGYRCPALNKAVGGTTKSQHISGEAADITAGSKSANRRLFNLLRSLRLPVDQVIDEHDFSWIHVSHSRARNRMMFFSA